MLDCVFCNIINRRIEAKIVHEDEDLIVINDILPKAPVHLLVIPKKHIPSITDMQVEDTVLGGKILLAAKEIARKVGISKTGYKLGFNVGKDGGQVVSHIHLHIMGGKKFSE